MQRLADPAQAQARNGRSGPIRSDASPVAGIAARLGNTAWNSRLARDAIIGGSPTLSKHTLKLANRPHLGVAARAGVVLVVRGCLQDALATM